MKKVVMLAAVALFVLAACQSTPKADKAKTGDKKTAAAYEGVTYKVDSNQVINFIGTKPVGEHHGTFAIKEGSVLVKNEVLVSGGKIIIDLKTLQITDKDTSGSAKLKGHLSSPDFFDVNTYPEASFEITSVEPFNADSVKNAIILQGATHTLTGNFTLKGVTKSISFPAIVTASPNGANIKANFNINRTDWGLLYGNDQSLGDKFIRPEVNISFDITAHKKHR